MEEKIINGLAQWLQQHEATWEEETAQTDSFSGKLFALQGLIEEQEKEMDGLQKQYENTFDLLEKGIYTAEIFASRNKILNEKISEIAAAIQETKEEYQKLQQAKENQISLLPKIRTILETYETLTPAEQNKLLKEVLDHVEYHKDNNGRINGIWQTAPDDFSIVLYPKVSKHF